MSDSFDLPTNFGARSTSTRIATRPDLQQLHVIKEKKTEQTKRIESHKSFFFLMKEFGAEQMINYENFGKGFLEVVTGTYFHKRIQMLKKLINDAKQEESCACVNEEPNVITIEKNECLKCQIEQLKDQINHIQFLLAQQQKEAQLRQALNQSGIQTPIEVENYRRTIVPAVLEEDVSNDELRKTNTDLNDPIYANN